MERRYVPDVADTKELFTGRRLNGKIDSADSISFKLRAPSGDRVTNQRPKVDEASQLITNVEVCSGVVNCAVT